MHARSAERLPGALHEVLADARAAKVPVVDGGRAGGGHQDPRVPDSAGLPARRRGICVRLEWRRRRLARHDARGRACAALLDTEQPALRGDDPPRRRHLPGTGALCSPKQASMRCALTAARLGAPAQVAYQLKLLTTAFFTVTMLKRHISLRRRRWLAVFNPLAEPHAAFLADPAIAPGLQVVCPRPALLWRRARPIPKGRRGDDGRTVCAARHDRCRLGLPALWARGRLA